MSIIRKVYTQGSHRAAEQRRRDRDRRMARIGRLLNPEHVRLDEERAEHEQHERAAREGDER